MSDTGRVRVTTGASNLSGELDPRSAWIAPVEGTDLQYVMNGRIPVIRVSATSWYAVSDGIWFVASGPYGPWEVATFVPPAIYGIPVSSPIHYVTYVRVYGHDDAWVRVGYTPVTWDPACRRTVWWSSGRAGATGRGSDRCGTGRP